jgi:hypothetical protein
MADILRTGLDALAAAVTRPYPDITPLIKSLTHVAQIQTGSVTGTGASLPVIVSGTPRCVIAFNRSAPCMVLKTTAMATKYGLLLTDAVALTYADEVITLAANLFTFGTEAAINTSAEVIEWAAFI